MENLKIRSPITLCTLKIPFTLMIRHFVRERSETDKRDDQATFSQRIIYKRSSPTFFPYLHSSHNHQTCWYLTQVKIGLTPLLFIVRRFSEPSGLRRLAKVRYASQLIFLPIADRARTSLILHNVLSPNDSRAPWIRETESNRFVLSRRRVVANSWEIEGSASNGNFLWTRKILQRERRKIQTTEGRGEDDRRVSEERFRAPSEKGIV